MKLKISIVSRVGIIALLIMSYSTTLYSAEKPYKTKANVICGDTKVEIVTEFKIYSPNTPPDCVGQELKLQDKTTGKLITTSSSGMPYNKELDNTCADGYQCLKGKKQSYLVLMYRTGGNCVECEWQGILDLKGNRIAVDRYKKQKTPFAHKWKELGLHGSPKRDIEFEAIPSE